MPIDLYVCTRSNPYCKSGTFFSGNMEEGLLKGRIVKSGRRPRDTKFVPDSPIRLPYASIAPYIIPVGYRIPMSDFTKMDLTRDLKAQEEVKEVEDFQSSNEDIIEPELEARGQKANPTVSSKSGVILDSTKRREE